MYNLDFCFAFHIGVFQNSEINTTNIANNARKQIINAAHEQAI